MAETPHGPRSSIGAGRLGPQSPAGSPPGTDPAGRVREAVGIFDSPEALQAAIDDLALAGFAQHELSLMAGDDTLRDRLGHVYRDIQDAKDDPQAPRQAIVAPEDVGDAKGAAIGIPAYIGAVVAAGAVAASGGTILAAVLASAAAGGGGGVLGGILANWIGQQREESLRQHMDKGGLLLWVNLRDGTREQLARDILSRHTAHPVEVHTIPQAAGSAGR